MKTVEKYVIVEAAVNAINSALEDLRTVSRHDEERGDEMGYAFIDKISEYVDGSNSCGR